MNSPKHHYISKTSLLTVAIIMCAFCLFDFTAVYGQDANVQLTEFNERRIDITKKSMLVLSGWALTNIAVGGYGYLSREGKLKYFHQMNAAWNIVNLSIGFFAYREALGSLPSSFSLSESLSEAHTLESILLLNIGLNIAYIATGSYLWERGIRKENTRLKGYGPSLVVQGGFLLLFDSILYAAHNNNNQRVYELLENVTLSANSISVTIPF